MMKEKRHGLNMNFEKTKTMVFGEKEWPRKMEIDGNQQENVEKCAYQGCLNTCTNDLESKKEILVRIAKAAVALSAMDKIWKSRPTSIHKKLKLEELKMCVQRYAVWMRGLGNN